MSYQQNGNKSQKITDEGRTVIYPKTGFVTFQPKGQSHSDYKNGAFGKK